MSNQTIYSYGSQKTAITSTGTCASNGFNSSSEVASFSTTDTGNFPLADAALFASFSTSVSSASNICVLYRRDKSIDSTNSAPIPQSAAPAYSAIAVGAFVIPPFTGASSGFFFCPDVPLSQSCEFYLENRTNASIITGFTVKITPKTFAPAP